MKTRSAIAAVSLVALMGVACGGGDEGGETGGTEAAGGDAGGAVTLTAVEFAWDPEDLSAQAGGSIELVNEDDAKHNLTIADAGVDVDVAPKATETVDLGGVAVGTWDFVCEYHPDTMKGTIEVTK